MKWTVVMKNHVQLITNARIRSHAYGVKLTRRFRDLIGLEEARSTIDFSLVKAAQRFDSDRGIPFFFYARVWIQRDLMTLLKKRIIDRRRFSDATTREPCTPKEHLEGQVLVEQLLNKLKRDERKLVRQHILEGHSLAELARRSNRHRAWACRLLKRALSRLRPFVGLNDSLKDAGPSGCGLVHHAVANTKITP